MELIYNQPYLEPEVPLSGLRVWHDAHVLEAAGALVAHRHPPLRRARRHVRLPPAQQAGADHLQMMEVISDVVFTI